jgi:hypothetical protein
MDSLTYNYKKLEEKYGVFKPDIRFYYVNIKPDLKGNPLLGMASVCIIKLYGEKGDSRSPVPVFCRGLSFCVPGDPFCKKLGRTAALGRAVQALERHDDCNPIFKKIGELLAIKAETENFHHYAEYNIALTWREKTLFNEVAKETVDVV